MTAINEVSPLFQAVGRGIETGSQIDFVTLRALNEAFASTPSIEQVKSELPRYPKQAIVIGIAFDGMPVIMDASSPNTGTVLVTAEKNGGKTDFLQNVWALSAVTHSPDAVSGLVVTPFPDEWETVQEKYPGITVVSPKDSNALSICTPVADRLGQNKSTQHIDLVLIDNYGAFRRVENTGLNRWINRIMDVGPANNVRTFMSYELEDTELVRPRNNRKQTHVFGYVGDPELAKKYGVGRAGLEKLLPGMVYALHQPDGFLHFWQASAL